MSRSYGHEVTVTGGTATAGTDFPNFDPFSFAVGNTVACDQITITDDTNDEGSETFTLAISTNVATQNPATTVVTISDDDDDADETYSWEDDDYQVSESAGSVTVCMIRTGNNNPQRTIPVSYSSGSANSNDYTQVGSWTFPANDNRECRSIPINNDNTYENDETFYIDISTTDSAGNSITRVTPYRTSVTIDDNDDDITYYWSQSSVSVAESTGAVSLCMRRSATANNVQNVQVSYSSGTAVSGVDFNNGGSNVFSFASNSVQDCNTVTIINDDDDENTESFTAQILSSGNINVGTPSVTTVSITDDDEDNDENIQWSTPSHTFGEASGTVSVTVTKTGGTSRSTTATVAAYSGSATAGSDFNLATTFISIPAGSSSATVSLTIINDGNDEPSESFTLVLSGATNNVGISQSTVTITITDNDPPAAVAAADDDGLTGGEIAGIVVGSLIGIILIAGIIILFPCLLMPGGNMCAGLFNRAPAPAPVTYQGGYNPGYNPGYI
ncbi:uncharacterized protein [Amphiura filiformis]|uniref:uncharacterized protein n=1 Tax=Amphiura filiformis TaxID=82378 RepID=UPI003B212AAE